MGRSKYFLIVIVANEYKYFNISRTWIIYEWNGRKCFDVKCRINNKIFTTHSFLYSSSRFFLWFNYCFSLKCIIIFLHPRGRKYLIWLFSFSTSFFCLRRKNCLKLLLPVCRKDYSTCIIIHYSSRLLIKEKRSFNVILSKTFFLNKTCFYALRTRILF